MQQIVLELNRQATQIFALKCGDAVTATRARSQYTLRNVSHVCANYVLLCHDKTFVVVTVVCYSWNNSTVIWSHNIQTLGNPILHYSIVDNLTAETFRYKIRVRRTIWMQSQLLQCVGTVFNLYPLRPCLSVDTHDSTASACGIPSKHSASGVTP